MSNNNITNFLKLKGLILENYENTEKKITLFLKREDVRPRCSCGESKLHIHDWRTRTLVDLPIHDKNVKLIIKRQRYKCTSCNKRILGEISLTKDRKKATARAYDSVKEKLKKFNFTQVGENIGLSITTVIRYFHNLVPLEQKTGKSIEVLHIDEFKGTSETGKYQTAICNGDSGRLFDVLPNRNQSDLIEYFKTLDINPKVCVIDMWRPFKRAIKEVWKDTVIVADKYHYVRQVQWAIKDVRIRVQKEHTILKRYWKLFAKNSSYLTEGQRYRLKELLKLDEELREVYMIKRYFDLYVTGQKGYEAHEAYDNWLDIIKKSQLKEVKDLEIPFENWYSEIVASFYYDKTNGLAEGINNRIKVTKRGSYGIRKFVNLKKLLLLKFS